MGNLYCILVPKGSTEVRLVQLEAGLQGALEDHFRMYEQQFYEGIDDVIGFDGGYRPDDNQLMHLPLTEEMQIICQQIDDGAVGRDVYDPRVDVPDDIRALLWQYRDGGVSRVLIQNFTRAQSIGRRGVVLRFTDRMTFNSFDEPSLLVENKIQAIIAHGRLEFKRFNIVKQIFDLSEVYREATNQDVSDFLNTRSVEVLDQEAFIASLNTTQRKLVFAVQRSDILNHVAVDEIVGRAQGVHINIPTRDGRVCLPQGVELTNILKFLDNSVYRSPVDDQRYMANSRRRMP